jgi:hypothetical protein
MNESAESLIAYCRENGRICPQPLKWNALWEMLPERRRVGSGWEPALPLILAAWHDSPALSKMGRFSEHIEWAEKHGNLPAVAAFLRNLPETDWYHLGD